MKRGLSTRLARVTLVSLAWAVMVILILVPLALVFQQAFSRGFEVYQAAISTPDAMSAVRLTLLAALISVPCNIVFGVAVAWLVTKYKIRGRALLLTLVDLPLAVSPVVVGLMFVLVYGTRGIFGPWLDEFGLKVIFATPGIILVTIFVTLPYIARVLIPLMDEQGRELEESALTLGASGWQVLRMVTLPSISAGLLYGAILCNARAMGEFGAVSVVSGHIRGLTNTLPLHVEILYNEYQFAAAFAVASLLTLLALVTVILQQVLERRSVSRELV
ncbi:MAG: sulfate ABC transporter permease subunit CysW [Deltaproteobacteria bacterium]|nr:sulfate ABC transporter permease subunit CysW [Deltaproteobacteria bacterium]